MKIPGESEKTDESKAWFIVKRDSIHIKTTTFSLWSVFACGGPKKKRATVYSSKPDPERNLIYLRFYVYSDNEDSRKVGNRLSRFKSVSARAPGISATYYLTGFNDTLPV